jgi:hypothetical protein
VKRYSDFGGARSIYLGDSLVLRIVAFGIIEGEMIMEDQRLVRFLGDTMTLLKIDFLNAHDAWQKANDQDATWKQGQFLGVYRAVDTVIQQMETFDLDPKDFGFDIRLDDFL